jgi:hypothetical protein
MSKYQCDCLEHEVECRSVVIKMVDGKAIHDVKCPCGEYMKLANPKTGAPGFRSNQFGQTY